jgi:Fe-S cluster assembly iron-binding protein IscA
MLELTDTATEVIRTIVDNSEMPAGSGLRVAGPNDGQEGLTISTANTPHEGDQVVESEGARVFVEPTAAVMLGDSALDARIDDDGAVQFMLTTPGSGSG